MREHIITTSPRHTRKVARILAEEMLVPDVKRRGAFVVALVGELGSGKTTFVQGFAEALGVQERVLSPTFVILKFFRTKKQRGGISGLCHIDCYRLKETNELSTLGFAELVADPENIVVIEWADRLKGAVPKGALWLKFSVKGDMERVLEVSDRALKLRS